MRGMPHVGSNCFLGHVVSGAQLVHTNPQDLRLGATRFGNASWSTTALDSRCAARKHCLTQNPRNAEARREGGP